MRQVYLHSLAEPHFATSVDTMHFVDQDKKKNKQQTQTETNNSTTRNKHTTNKINLYRVNLRNTICLS